MNKLYGFILAFAGFIASLFIANLQGKKKGKEEEKNKQIKDTLKNVKETQDRINEYNSTSASNKREWLRKRKSPRNK